MLIDKKLLARELGLSVRTIETWTRQPGFPVHKLGGARRYALADVLAWFQRGHSRARGKPSTLEEDVASVALLVRRALAGGYQTEGVALRGLADRVGASSAIGSTLAAQVRNLVARRG